MLTLRAPYVNTGQNSEASGKEFPENVVFIQGNQSYYMYDSSL